MTTLQRPQNDRIVALWLVFCAAVVFGMIMLGAVTRLTGSGLSMVEWKPLVGVVPPLSEQAWMETFQKYKQYPEYQKVNKGMSLHEFKQIFMFEYLHRVLGRLIGVIFFFPMLYFAVRGQIRRGLMPHLWLLFLLGGLQGLLGWYMVKSGLVNMPRVSQYRLTAHLGLAVAIYAYMVWLVFDLLFMSRQQRPARARPLAKWSLALVGLIYLMILSGGLVAGTRAGYAYATWPLMGDSFIPPGLYQMTPVWLSAFEDITTIQFNHRMFAYLLCVLIGGMVVAVMRSSESAMARSAALFMGVALVLQVTLGVSTLLLHMPVPIATAHQGGAVLLLTATLFLSHTLVRQ
ncbi:MAG: COX15/CtaA family protein [Gammaproteobacteria bacterium]|jgi:cytochrome c oxidase assembly protein subunit 15|nr:COX15/CtaA family protein [Gammaproteobacteria bacterium]